MISEVSWLRGQETITHNLENHHFLVITLDVWLGVNKNNY